MSIVSRIARIAAAAVLTVAGVAPAAAQRANEPPLITLGAGAWNVLRADDKALEFRAEYRTDYQLWWFRPFVGVTATSDLSVYGFGGLLLDIFFGPRIVLTPSLAVGLYGEGDGIDLGHVIEFRDSIELAWRFDDRSRLGFVFYHMSNAGIGSRNPGVEVFSLNYSIPLGAGFPPTFDRSR